MKKNIFLLLILWFSLYAFGQPNYKIRRLNLHDGLPSNIVTHMGQTPDNLMWFSSWNGLSSYDGYDFTTFNDRNCNERTLTTNRLLRFNTSPETGNIWCLAYDRNVFLFERSTSRFINVSDFIKSQKAEFITGRISTLPNGTTWIFDYEKRGWCFRVDEHKLISNKGKDMASAYQMFTSGGKNPQIGSSIYGVFPDSKNREWLLTSGGTQLVGTAYSDTTSYYLAIETDRQVFFCTHDGRIGTYDEQKHKIIPVNLGLASNKTTELIKVNDHSLAVQTNKGLLIYDTQKHNILRLTWPTGTSIGRIMADNHGRIWVFPKNGTPMLVMPTTGKINILPIKGTIPALPQSNINMIHEDHYGNCWIATENGFFGYYDEKNQQLVSTPIRSDAGQAAIARYYSDNRGDLWITGEHDVTVLNFSRPIFKHITLESLHQVRSIYYDNQNRLWLGDIDGHVIVLDKDNHPMGYLGKDGQLHPTPQFFSTHIYCFYEDSRGRLWIGTKGDGLYCLQPDGHLNHFLHDVSNVYSLCSNQIYDVYEDHLHRLWIGTFERGICLMDESEQVRFIHYDNELKGYPVEDYHKVRRITETADGAIIVSASNGLVTFSEQFNKLSNIRFYAHKHIPGDPTSLYTSDVMQTYVTHSGRIFVATVGGSLQEITDQKPLHEKLKMRLVNRVHENTSGTILSLQEDLNHHLWIGCESSLIMYQPEKDLLWSFGPGHLGERTELTEAPSAVNRQTGHVAFATTDGCLIFHPNELSQKVYVPPIVFKSVSFHGQENFMRVLSTDQLDVPANQRNLTIHFAALDYQDNHMIHYAYKLEGIDDNWNDLDQAHSISFSNLPAGHHRLLVRSTNQYGSWADNTQALNIYVHPTFWETWWAILLYVLLGLGVVGLAVWIYRLYTRASMEQQLNQMKTQFFTDISHKLRTPLTLIGSPVKQVLDAGGLTEESRQHLEMVHRNAHNMLQLVNKMLTYGKDNKTYISDGNLPSEAEIPSQQTDPSKSPLSSMAANQGDKQQEATRLLIVEDNADLRKFLISILQSDYAIIEASNGREGLEKALTTQPDFILTDVMMPEMDGLEMVRQIKANAETSHIPIVILSAKASLEDRLEGLRIGVNDYITKPFSATYLKQRMQNIISNQHTLQQNYLEQLEVKEESHTLHLRETVIVDSDKQMMEELLNYIENHLSDPDLKIEDLASAVCLGRTVFYNKVKSLVGMSPVELLRHIRIKHAEDMVAKSQTPFSQIAYSVGFSDSRYFGKCFKKQTGLTPSEYREQLGRNV